MKRILFIILFFYGLVLFPQAYKITHNGGLSGNWMYDPRSSEIIYHIYYTGTFGVEGSDEDKYVQLYINWRFTYGGVHLTANNNNVITFYSYFISDEYSKYINNNASDLSSVMNREDYYLSKYGKNGLAVNMLETNINGYKAVYRTSTADDFMDDKFVGISKSYNFFIFIDGDNGIEIDVLLRYIKDQSTQSMETYENLMFQHIKELQFTPNGTDTLGSTSTTSVATTPDSNDDDTPWTVIIGGISAAAVAAIIRKILKKNATKQQQNKKDDKKDEEEEAHYILQLNRESIKLTLNQPELLQIQVWKVTIKGKTPVQAQINIQNPEKNLSINSQTVSNGLTAQLLLEKQPSQTQFNLIIQATAEGNSIQKQVEVLADGKMQILVQTQPDNRRTLRPDTNKVLTCYAEVVDETGKSVPELTKKIQFKPQSDWIDLSDPMMDKNQIIINVAASNPDQVNVNSHIPKNVTLTLLMDDVKDDEEPLKTDLTIELLDCKLDTDVSQCSFPVTDNQTEVTINAFIENAPGDEPWTFEADYKYANERVEPLTNISISKKSDTEAIITLTGPIEKPETTQTFLSKTLVISAYQGNEKPLERHINVMVTQVGLFIKHGVDSGNQIAYMAQGKFERNLEFVLYKFDEKTKEIVVDKEGLKHLKFTLKDEEQDIVNFESVLSVSYEFIDLTGNIPYGRYQMESTEQIPGFGDVFTLTYLVEAPCSGDENPEQFQLELQLKVKTYGIGSEFPDWVEAYNNCKKIIFNHVPNGDAQSKLYELLEARKYTLGAEGLNEMRKRIWKIAYNLILAEGAEGYKAEEKWANAITTTLEWTEWAGDLAFNALAAYYMKGNPMGSVGLSMTKATMIEALNYYIYENGTVEGFMDLQYQKILPLLINVAKGRLISVENIEMVVKKNKPLAIAIFVSCEFVFNLYQTKSVVEAAKLTAAQLRDEFIIQKLTLHLHKNQLKYNIKMTTVDESLKDVMDAVKTKDGKQYIDLEKVVEIMRDPAQVRTLKNSAPDWLKKVFDDSRNEIYKKHDADLKKHISDTYKLDPNDIKIDDFRTPGTEGSFNLNTDRDYRVLRKVKTNDGQEIWVELQRENWIDKSYEIFGEHTKKPYGMSDKEWAEKHLQRATDRFDAEAGKDYSDHIFNSDTGEIIKGEPNIVKVKHGEGTLYDAEGIGKMYQNKVNNALEPGTIPEAYAQAQKAVDSLDKVKKSYIGQDLPVKETPANLKEAMDVIKSAKTDANASPESIEKLNNKLKNLEYKDVGEVAKDIADEFKNLKSFDNKSQVFNVSR